MNDQQKIIKGSLIGESAAEWAEWTELAAEWDEWAEWAESIREQLK